MSAESLKKRRMSILRQLADRASCRHDIPISLSAIAPSLTTQAFVGGTRFVDSDNPVYEGGSDSAYDFNTLFDEGFIEPTHLEYTKNKGGQSIGVHPAVKVTPEGLEAIAEFQRSWLRKAIDKEPVTFLQIVITVVASLLSFLAGAIATKLW